MTEHSGRAHATWSASATARNWACAGALALGATVERLDVESEAAAWGTACHQLAEKCLCGLKAGVASNFIGETEKTKRHSFVVDEEMADCAQVYVDYVIGRQALQRYHGLANTMWIEERFSLAKLNPPFDAGGTCDAIIYNPDEKMLEVVDLKGGRGIVVDVTENKQLRTYALGALLAHSDLDVVTVRSTIVQPRAPHKDGRIRSETYHIVDLMEWTGDLVARMKLSKEAMDAYAEIKGDLMREAWADKYVVAGDHCTFCPAAGICPALERKALAVANAFFNDSGVVETRNQPAELDPERIGKVLDGADMLTGWLNAVRALATRLAESGTEIPGYHLAEKLGNRRWRDRGERGAMLLGELGMTDDEIFVKEIRSPAAVERKLGHRRMTEDVTQVDVTKKRRDWLADMIERPVTGRTLVSAAKSTKPAVKPAAQAFFDTGALS